MVICLERGADLHMVQLMPLPLTLFSPVKSRLVLTFWYRLTWVVPDKGPLNGCVCVCVVVVVVVLTIRCGDSADNTVEENSSVFSLIRMHWLPSARHAGSKTAPTTSSSS